MNLKILAAVFLAFSISFTMFFLVQKSIWAEFFTDIEDSEYLQTINTINSMNFDENEKKILILGSSHVKHLLLHEIEKKLYKENSDLNVFNFAIGGDSPKDRIKRLEEVIATNPMMVVYGVGFRDFQVITQIQQTPIEMPESFLPNAKELSEIVFFKFEKFSDVDLDFLKSAQQTTLRGIRELIDGDKSLDVERIAGRNPVVMSEEELRKPRWISQASGKILPLSINKEFDAFREIIQTLKQNEVKVVIFSTPHSSIFLEAVPDETKIRFENILNTIAEEYDVPVYRLHDKYQSLDIWSDNTHVAYNITGIVYSNDISEIILQNVD